MLRIFEITCDRMIDLDEGIARGKVWMVGRLSYRMNRADSEAKLLSLRHQVFHVVLEQFLAYQCPECIVVGLASPQSIENLTVEYGWITEQLFQCCIVRIGRPQRIDITVAAR